jgi:hypothetical protein
MPRKRRQFAVNTYSFPIVAPTDRNAVTDHDLVGHALVDFEELSVLTEEARGQLVEDLVQAVAFYRTGLDARKRGVSNSALATQVFFADVERSLGRANIPAKRWRKQYDNGGGESLYYRIVREVGDVCGIPVPKDPKLAGNRASQFRYD